MPASRRGFLGRGLWGAVTASLAPCVHAGGAGGEKIKVGQIGTAHAHASKLAVFRDSPEFEVVGLVEPSAELRGQAAEQRAYKDLPWMTREQLLETNGLQLVLVETAVRDLLDNAEACVAAGKHVHLDKPAGESLPQFQRILELAERTGLLVQLGYMYRYNPGIVLLRELLAAGWLGEIFEVHAVMSKVVDPQSRRGLADYRGGIFFELGCHVTDLVLGVLGSPEKVTPFPRQVVSGNDALLDNMLAVFEYSRALATVKSSAVEVEGGARRHIVVCGTQGTLQVQPLDNPRVELTLDRARGKYSAGRQVIELPRYIRYVDDAADMARVIRGERPPLFSLAHELAVQKTVLQACALPLT
jgi:predicted dehydrogenase